MRAGPRPRSVRLVPHLSRPPRLDLALAAGLVVIAVVEVIANARIDPKPASLLIEIVMAAALAWRRTAPLTASVVVALCSAADAAIGVSPDVPIIPMVSAVALCYALVSFAPLRTAILGNVVLLAGVLAQIVIAHQSLGNFGFAFTFMMVFWAIGRLVRIRTAQAVRAQLEIERLQQEAAERERQIAADERARIAHEMHDVIAHSVSVMVVQAGGIQQVIRKDPGAAEAALDQVQAVGRQAITDLGRLLGVLREDGAEVGLAPQPRLADLPVLVDQARAAGLHVDLTTTGATSTMPPGVELAVYRIVQEALTNARKHAGAQATVRVRLDYGADEIAIDVCDDGTGSGAITAMGTGHGLVGMRERISTYGGSLVTGREATGGFRVRARIPVGVS